MTTLPTITAAALLRHLVDTGIVTQMDLISLLGPDRHRITLNALEMALVRENMVGEDRLAEIKSELSGRTAYLDYSISPTTRLDAAVSARYGALVLDREPLTIAMVEDTPENVSGVVEALGVSSFEIWLTTAPAYASLRKEAYSGRAKDDRPYARDLFEVLDAAMETRGTDIHLAVGIPPRVRADGTIRELHFKPLDRLWLAEQIKLVAEPRHIADLDHKFSTDLAYTFGPARFRVNIAMDANGHTMALRRLPSAIPKPDDIGLPESIRKFAHLERGMVLVTGPTGSGKSTTLAAILNEIIMHSSRHVITLEDPIEFRFPTDLTAHVNQRELGQSFYSFADGLRDALRQDPDVVLVGELRDAETISTAVTAAETGHLVFGSLHTYDAASTIMRLVNAFPANEQDAVRSQLSSLLKGVVSQILVPRAGGKGRVAAHEVMINTTAISSNLRKPDGHFQIKQTMQTSLSDGMITMEASLAKLVVQGQVSRSEAEFRARDLDEFKRSLDYFATQVTKSRVSDS